MVSNISTYNVETGFEFRRQGLSLSNVTIVNPLEQHFDKIRFAQPANNTFLHVHVHHINTLIDNSGIELSLAPVPSHGDLFEFARIFSLFSNIAIAKEYKSIVVTTNGLYAFSVKNTQGLDDFVANISNPKMRDVFAVSFEKNVIKKANDETLKKFSATPGSTQQELDQWVKEEFHKAFINYIDFLNATFSIGIDIYSGKLSVIGEYRWTKITK